MEDDKQHYSRGIGVVGEEEIVDCYERYGGIKPPPIDHEGLRTFVSEQILSVPMSRTMCWQRPFLVILGRLCVGRVHF